MVKSETSLSPEEPEDFRAQAHRAALEEGSGFSPRMADIRVSGTDSDEHINDLAVRVRRAAIRSSTPRRRGGRSYVEPSDNDLDPDWNTPYVPPTDEELAERRQVLDGPGHRAARIAGAIASREAAIRAAEGQPIGYRMALERARLDKRQRDKNR